MQKKHKGDIKSRDVKRSNKKRLASQPSLLSYNTSLFGVCRKYAERTEMKFSGRRNWRNIDKLTVLTYRDAKKKPEISNYLFDKYG